MFKNYLVIAFRNMMRQKLYALINIVGLALGIACCALMALFVKYEWSHDRFHENKDQVFRLVKNELRPNGAFKYTTIFAPEIPQALKDEIPAVTHATGYIQSSDRMAIGEKNFRGRIGLVHADFLEIFTFPLAVGDPTSALNRPDGIVITESLARKFFDQIDSNYDNVMGQSLEFPARKLTFVITGIARDVPDVSSLSFEALVPAKHSDRFGKSNIGRASMSIYMLLDQGQTVQAVETTLRSFMPEPLAVYVDDRKKWNLLHDSENAFSLSLQPLTDIYWSESIANYYEDKGNLTGVYILWGVAIVVLLIACSNFTTLSVAQSANRALEVGMRKVLGANRKQVMQQFWSEALLLSFISLLVGVLLAEIFLPVFNGLVQRELTIDYWNDKSFVLILLLIIAVVGVVSGSYPSLVMSRFQPIIAMKGDHRIGGRNRLVRGLVVLQYAASIAMMICTGVMIEQQQYVKNKNLGYDQEQVVVVRTDGKKVDPYKDALLKDPRILGVTSTDRAFTTGSSSTGFNLPDGSKTFVRLIRADPDFISTLRIDLIDGRNFSDDHPSDRTQSVIINETLARRLGYEQVVGKTLSGFKWRSLEEPMIIGVVRDFHMDGLRWKIQPLVLQMRHFQYWPSLMIRLHPEDIVGTVDRVKQTWKTVVSPTVPIRLSFLDKNLDNQYRSDQHWQRVLTYASGFAITISCLGLFGLASLSVVRRTKEIGIRKVMGASVSHLVGLLSKDFVKLLLIASVIACPVVHWAMEKWLENFAYRIDLGPTVFVLGIVMALVVALLTISLQTYKAARNNPVDALRSE